MKAKLILYKIKKKTPFSLQVCWAELGDKKKTILKKVHTIQQRLEMNNALLNIQLCFAGDAASTLGLIPAIQILRSRYIPWLILDTYFKHSIIPVSYTHLDVYKRQLYSRNNK